MGDLGNLLELLHTARDRFTTIRATVHYWYNRPLMREAHQRWEAKQYGGIDIAVSDSTSPPPRQSQGGIQRRIFRLWLQKEPLRWRDEVDRKDGKGASVEVEVGDASRLYWEHRALALGFDPSPIISDFSLEPLGRAVHAGREAIKVKARPRSKEYDPWELWMEVDEYELLVDAERGILLYTSVWIDSQWVAAFDIAKVVFDEELPEGLFAIPSPQG
jgi:hypothetical protein